MSHSSYFFKHIFNILSSINTEAKIYFNKNNICVGVVDPAHVSMVNIDIPKYSIESYNIDKDIILAFDLDKINHMFKNTNKNDLFSLKYDSDIDLDKSFINIGFFNHTLSLIKKDSVPDKSKVPVLNLPVKFNIATKIIYDFLIQANKITDYIEIIADINTLTFNAFNDTDKVTITLNRDQINNYVCDEKYKSCFSVDYMLNIIKSVKPLFENLSFIMGHENPINIIGNNGYNISFLLAPRIESE